MTIDGVDCVVVEPDIDYYRDPAVVYVLRWIAGHTAGIPEFEPLYTFR